MNTISPVLVREIETIIKNRLWRYRTHPEYEEIVSQAHVEVWEYVDRLPWDAAPSRPLIAHMVGFAPAHYLGSHCHLNRKFNVHGDPVVPTETLESWVGTAPDFAPALIERLWREGVLAELAAGLTAKDWQFLETVYLEEVTMAAAARTAGQSRNAWSMMKSRVLKRARQVLSEAW